MEINDPSTEEIVLSLTEFFTVARHSRESDDIHPEWKCNDFTTGHVIVTTIAMLSTYIIQLVGFIIALAFIDPIHTPFAEEIAIIEPVFEISQMTILVFLVHFQFHAFYVEPFSVMKIISKKLLYSNISISVISTAIFISFYSSHSRFTEIFQMISLIIFLLLSVRCYYKLYRLNRKNLDLPVRQILGFHILYSLTIPYAIIEIVESIIIVACFYDELSLSQGERAVIFSCFYFATGVLALVLLKDIYMGIGFVVNLVGVFVMQSSEVCVKYTNYCSTAAQLVPALFSGIMVVCIGIACHYYPKAYKYQFLHRKFLK